MNQGTRGPFPTPGFFPPSNPHPSKVGDGLIIQGDLGGRAPTAGLGGVGGAGSGVQRRPLDESIDHSSRSVAHSGFPSYKWARPLQPQIIHPKVPYPALVCY